MKRLSLSLLVAALLCIPASAQTTCTPGGGVTCTTNLNLWVLPQHYQNWGVIPWNQNASEIDAFSLTVPIFSPAASQTITQPPGTWLNIDGGLVFGSPSWLRFGVTANTPDSAVTRTAAGAFSLDTTTSGDGLAKLALAGLTITGTAPTPGQCLSWGGTSFNTPITCLSVAPTVYYQTVAANGVAQTQRPTLNFNSYFTLTDSASPAESTVAPVTTGSEAKLVTAAAAGTIGDCATWNASGGLGSGVCAYTGTDQYFSVSLGATTLCTLATSTDAGCTGTINLPVAFADANYFVTTQVDSPDGAFLFITLHGSKLAGSFPYSLTCTFGCSSFAGGYSADIHAYHP